MKPRPAIETAWTFTSSSNSSKLYQTLLYVDGTTSCDCPGWTRRVATDGTRSCKHVRLVEMGFANVHCAARKDYGNKRLEPAQRTSGRKFDFSE